MSDMTKDDTRRQLVTFHCRGRAIERWVGDSELVRLLMQHVMTTGSESAEEEGESYE